MARKQTTRKLEVFALHGHREDAQFNYREFFRTLEAVPPRQRDYVVGDAANILLQLRVRNATAGFIVYEGPRNQVPLIVNVVTARRHFQRLRPGEIVVTATHGLVNFKRREAIIEYNHRGAKAATIAKLFEEVARRETSWTNAQFELTPVVDETFAQAIASFRRIRVAAIRVVKPNASWTDRYKSLMGRLLEDSNAGMEEVTVYAERGESLVKTKGIVGFIRHSISEALPSLKGATVTGAKGGSNEEVTASLTNYIEHERVRVDLTDSGHVNTDDIERKLKLYMSARERRGGDS